MAARKLHYYISNADTTIRSDHMPLRKFLMKNTKNATVNNWAVAIEDYNLKFEYIKGIKNTLADTMSRLVRLDPDTALPPEPDHEEVRYSQKEKGQVECCQVYALPPDTLRRKGDRVKMEAPSKTQFMPTWGFKDEYVKQAQGKDRMCRKIFQQAEKNGEKTIHPYYLENGILMKYVSDNKQRFEVVVVPPEWGHTLLKLAHDDLGHNGTARTYMALRRSYYWKGMKTFVTLYIKRCSLCREHNATATRYVKGSFEIPKAPMDFISMDLIGEFHPPSSNRNKYASDGDLHVDRLGMVHPHPGQDCQCHAESLPTECSPRFWSV